MKETWCSQLRIVQATDNQGWVPGLDTLPDLSNSASLFLHVLVHVHVGTRCEYRPNYYLRGDRGQRAKGVRGDDVQMAISSGI